MTRNEKVLYANIEAERARKGLSQEDFTAKLGVTTKTYRNWQKGLSDIPASKLAIMAKLFNCSIDYLLETEVERR